MQFHGTATRYQLAGATAVATLYSDAATATSNPAVTLRDVGANGGQAAAFAYDLATSVVYTRQGNPAWANQERDGFAPQRSDDKYYGDAVGDPQADWVDLNKVAIPQADEQQRLLANLILHTTRDQKPLPRFWYFPRGEKAVVIMTGDDHGNNGTEGRWNQFLAASPAGCSVEDWECVRGTSYMYPGTPLSDVKAAAFEAQGFEVGLHINTSCADYTEADLESFYTQQIADFKASWPSVRDPSTQRHHCIAWTDWVTGAKVQSNHGVRLDTSYYFWPPSWAQNRPGFFNGSGMPMRFADLDGTLIDVYQAATQMTDESGQEYPFTVDTLLDRALGTDAYYGAFTVNAHTDVAQIPESDAVLASALSRSVPIVTSRQMLEWLDGRNDSSFGSITWDGEALGFTVTTGAGANGLQALVPWYAGAEVVNNVTRDGASIPYTRESRKGVEYAGFLATDGTYTVTYLTDTTAPTVVSVSPSAGSLDVSVGTLVTATFSEPMDAATLTGATFQLANASGAPVVAEVSYNAETRTATLAPSSSLEPDTTYTATVSGGGPADLSGNALAADVGWGFTTGDPLGCPCSVWTSSDTPAIPSAADPNAVEVGVKFRSDIGGFITGIRFYKGGANTGTHVGNLWTDNGTLLATAVFTNETASGWQQVEFGTPVPISANTVYVASYHAPNGGYAVDSGYFAGSGVDNPPLHLLPDGESGGNGMYLYGSGGFPTNSFGSSNYWVDVVFVTSTGPDTTAPTVTATLPLDGAVDVPTRTDVTATFSEPMDPATVTEATFDLRDGGGALVAATVAYDEATRTASLTPDTALSLSTDYSATVKGGVDGVKDLAGNALASDVPWTFTTAAVDPCATPANPVVAENCLAGNPPSEWDISGVGDPTIQGFATDISVNRGEIVDFKIDTDTTNYRLDIYRMGYYGGDGARKVATVLPSATLPQTQPPCLEDSATSLIDCGNWAVSASWSVPAGAPSGIYFAKVVREDSGGASHIVFVVRDDTGSSDVLFQTSDTTWHAYNTWGGNSLYTGTGPGTGGGAEGRAYKVSYNRPFNTRGVDGGQDWLFNAEYPMVRWLEANGYDVAYFTGVDSDRFGSLIQNHNVFLSVGHDEYWSGQQRANVEAARDAGVHLAFFSGNEVFWKTRWESSIDGSGTDYRTLVCYKETHDFPNNTDPQDPPIWTGTWRDPRNSPPADGGQPENALTGTIFTVNDGATASITVPSADGKMRFWRNTTVADLPEGASATFPDGTLGYEWDEDLDNGFRPAGLVRMSATTVENAPVLTDYGSTFGSGTATHYLTLYRAVSGALVFGAGTVQWSWGLDANHDRAGTPIDARMQQATANLFADMGVQPATLQAGLAAGAASTDATAPISTITSPSAGATVPQGVPLAISGTATDAGGGVVGGVEVSVDGGTIWHPVSGRETWSYTWMPITAGSLTIKSRTVDDSGNLETPSAGVTVTVQAAPLAIATASLPNGTVGAAYSATLAATGGTGPYNWSIVSGSLPSGLALNAATGAITGTPTAATTSTFTIQVTDSAIPAATSSKALSISVTATPTTVTIWPSTAVPGLVDGGADSSVELGVKFRSDVAGIITGIRFYKASDNTGTHVGNLWSSTGTNLATVTFTGETGSGWQQMLFSSPVAITANTVYVASYHADAGHYSADVNYFATTGVDNPPLHALADGVSGGNGVFAYGTSSAFPTQTWNAANYWVDVVFNAGAAPTLSSIALTPANPAIAPGATQQFTATGTYSDNSTQNLTTQVTWTSLNTAVATVSAGGLATGVSAGTTTISATLSSVSGSTGLTVQAAPLSITTASLPNGTVNVAYSATLAATGGTGPYNWSIVSGSLPSGLALNAATGAISGTPTAAATSNFTVQVTDSATPSVTTSKALSISVTATPATVTITVNGASYTVVPYGGAQDGVAVTTVENGGTALHMVGNAWKQVALNYTVTANTVLEFDFESGAQGEIHAIGFDTDETLSPNRAFQVYGTQSWGEQAFRNYPGSGVVHYTIPVGQFFTGDFTRLIFANDHDVAIPTADGRFSNIIVHEVGAPGDADGDGVVDASDLCPGTPTGEQVDADGCSASQLLDSDGDGVSDALDVCPGTPAGVNVDTDGCAVDLVVNAAGFPVLGYAGAQDSATATTTVEDNGAALHMVGNAWKQVALNYTVTANTVLEFDFESGAQGEIHAIGFDTDETLSPNRAFQVYGTQSWGEQAFRNYPGSGVVHYTIPVGQYFTGNFTRLIFANDHDVPAPDRGRQV